MARRTPNDFEVWYSDVLGPTTADNVTSTGGTFEIWYSRWLSPAEYVGTDGVFPRTPLLDDFTRANENPLSAGGMWTTATRFANPMELVSHRARPTSTVGGSARTTFCASDAEVYLTLAVPPVGGSQWVSIEVMRGTDARDGYSWGIWGDGTSGLYRDTVALGFVAIATLTPFPVAAGDGIGMRYEAAAQRITLWYRAGLSGSWVKWCALIDTVNVPPFTLVFGGAPSVEVDDVGGGWPSAESWTNELGTSAYLLASLDETTAIDTDYIQSSLAPVMNEVTLRLGPISVPMAGAYPIVQYRYSKDQTGGQAIALVVRLYAANGSTLIAEQVHTNIDALTNGSFALTAGQTAAIPTADYTDGLILGFEASAWQTVRRAQVNAGTTPWDFSSIDLSSAGSTATRATGSPPGLIEGASFLTFTCSGVDGENGRARGTIEPAVWPASWRGLRAAFWVYLPTGFKTSIPVGGSAQIWKLDPFPTTNNQVCLLYYQTDDDLVIVVKDAGVDTNASSTFTISEGAWHRIDIQMLLSSSATGKTRVMVDGVLVASGTGVKTIYATDNGSGHKIPYVRYGLAAHGTGQTAATTCHIDDCLLEYVP